MNTPPPLPRSLDPLPDESLPGYLLRLSHRVRLSPADLAAHTGLVPRAGDRLPITTLVAVEPDQATTFAHMTGLSVAQVTNMTLGGLTNRYLPMIRKRNGRQRDLRGTLVKENWVSARCTRYCPECLAGDPDSAIQQRHGGGWNLLWRLPVMFACVEHRRLLQQLCPECGRPAHHRTINASLLPLPSIATLHPTACRNRTGGQGPHTTACGYRLDNPSGPSDQIANELLAVQARIADLLSLDGPATTSSVGQPTSPPGYFTDLRIITCLIAASWPAGRHLFTNPHQAQLIDEHLRQRHDQIAAARATGRVVRPLGILDQPPADPATCAALLTAADSFLGGGDVEQVRHSLRPLFANATATLRLWTHAFIRLQHCSPGLDAAIGTEVNTQRRIKHYGKIRPVTPAPRDVQFTLNHVPQHLPEHWQQTYFRDFADISKPRLLRRAVSVRLAQFCLGGRALHVAPLLGIPGSAAVHAIRTVDDWLDTDRRRTAFAEAVDALADHLGAATTRIDYGNRRDKIAAWSLPIAEWNDLTDDLMTNTNNSPAQSGTHWGEGKRLLASTWVWVHVTQGEHLYAPPSRDPHKPRTGDADARYINHRWRFLEAGKEGHYIELRRRLGTYAANLATAIDTSQFEPPRNHEHTRGLTPSQLAHRPAPASDDLKRDRTHHT